MQLLSPVQTREREILMDVSRAFAILEIFIANLYNFNFFNEQEHARGRFLLQEWGHMMLYLLPMFIGGKFFHFQLVETICHFSNPRIELLKLKSL